MLFVQQVMCFIVYCVQKLHIKTVYVCVQVNGWMFHEKKRLDGQLPHFANISENENANNTKLTGRKSHTFIIIIVIIYAALLYDIILVIFRGDAGLDKNCIYVSSIHHIFPHPRSLCISLCVSHQSYLSEQRVCVSLFTKMFSLKQNSMFFKWHISCWWCHRTAKTITIMHTFCEVFVFSLRLPFVQQKWCCEFFCVSFHMLM